MQESQTVKTVQHFVRSQEVQLHGKKSCQTKQYLFLLFRPRYEILLSGI